MNAVREQSVRAAILAGTLVGCGANTPADDRGPESGGMPAQSGGGGATGTGGASASGGQTIGGAGGSFTGGTPGSGGFSGAPAGGTGGTAPGGTGGTGGNEGGTSAGGEGSGGGGGTAMGQGGASSALPEPSAGCGKGGRPAGGTVTVANDHIYTFPESYDGTKPFPLLLAFHACGNPIEQFLNLTRGSKFETEYVRAFPRSSDPGGCWNYGNDIRRVTAIYDELTSKYCVDLKHVFGTGHSSGAQMIVQILAHEAVATHVRFKAVSPVAASDYGALSGPTPVLYIHGKKDTVRGDDGASTVARFRTANGCGTTSTTYSPVMGCQSSGKTVNPGCISYDGCDVPTIWCSHDDPQYGTTSHGVPCFAVKAMHDFFGSLP